LAAPFAATHKAVEVGTGFDAERRKAERGAVGKIRQVLGEQLERVLAVAYYGVDNAFWEHEREVMTAAMLPIIGAIVRKAIEFAVTDLNEQVNVGVDRGSLEANLAKWARTYTYDLIKGIDGNTRKAVQQAMENWAITGGPIDELKNMLEPTFGKTRAELIAETESVRAFGQARMETWKESRVIVGREWRTAQDERVCPICNALNEQQAMLGQPFVTSFGEFWSEPAHPRCRCWTVPVIGYTARPG